jgi:hypothetical protein
MERLFPHPRMSYIVMGAAKSGTTWMQRLLSAHPEVHCAESRLAGDYLDTTNPSGIHLSLEKFVGLLSRHYFPPIGQARQGEFYRTLLFNLIDTIGETSIKASGKRIYGEKLTPFLGTASAAVKLLAEYNPGLRFVHLVRDGRDVIVSGFAQRTNARIARSEGQERARQREMLERREVSAEEFDFFLGMWIGAVKAGMEARELFPAHLELRYERCLEEPEAEARRLLEFVGADSSERRVRECVQAGSFEKLSGRARGEEDRSSFFRKGVAGDWRKWLSEVQVEEFERRAGELRQALGYAEQ